MFPYRNSKSRSKQSVLCSMLAGLLCFSIVNAASADGVYDYLPEDALGFVTFRNLSEIDTKAQKLTELFEIPLPAPLTFVKLTTGLNEGLHAEGDVLVALLPGATPTSEPEPMVLLPISDYPTFAESIHGDASGEICRVSIAGEDVLVAKDREYALLMNVEHRETLEVLLDMEPKPVADLQPLEPWLAKNDVAVAIMPAGAELLIKLGNDALAKGR
ncbi:MAG: hypothetical protein MI725_07240, partial [Pirellulales bacterium]|nr:hypothetical protein [Pirellulales bacterium]